ncbi:ATP-grasp domain-containing protein [Salinicoccus halitifaciens]|uniref:D-alanine-D-alanine ligase-like ATP-grasp enzyme n=1 Tax=Salinicoccus halitifaciens TaxID=1073415 RepID=A0ABV2ECA4_9STAP|nr:ATP-grasp domain-containing protein [Salinicoccus halitifaciens]MCD2137389.1 ATP-grasp domain-containing protein [Salinicoccus halitifaciens]
MTKQYLKAAGVPVPEGKMLSIHNSDYNEAAEYAGHIGYPVIVKPAEASLAIGVRTNIQSKEDLHEALDHVHVELGYKDIIIERHAAGYDTRTYVAGDQVIASFKRVRGNIIGDGESSIMQLIEMKNKYRKMNPHLSGDLIEVEENLIDFINEQGYQLDSILENGKKVDLSGSTFAKDYSETVDITDELTENFKKTAVEAIRCLPGMNLAGVDIIMDQENDRNYVLEVNCRPNIGGHLFPVIGQSRDVPGAIIDYYFPETAEIEKKESAWFTFDFDSITDFLKKGIVKEVTLPPLPKKNVVNKHLIITGDIEKYDHWLFKSAIGHRVGGHMKKITCNKARLIIAGRKQRVEVFMEKLSSKSSIMDIELIDENRWDSHIMYKFEVFDEMKPVALISKEGHIESENRRLKKENEQLKKEMSQLKESNSWKVTRPLRMISRLRKND